MPEPKNTFGGGKKTLKCRVEDVKIENAFWGIFNDISLPDNYSIEYIDTSSAENTSQVHGIGVDTGPGVTAPKRIQRPKCTNFFTYRHDLRWGSSLHASEYPKDPKAIYAYTASQHLSSSHKIYTGTMAELLERPMRG